MVFLAVLACALLTAFQRDTNQLIHPFAAGMVKHWRCSMATRGLGAGTPLLVSLAMASPKCPAGAWIVVLLISLPAPLFPGIDRHYQHVEDIPVQPAPACSYANVMSKRIF
jgi:hypothetical protein